MPIYEYQCTKNKHRFEVIRKFSDPPLEKCRHCDSKVVKLISQSAFVLKGSGFYKNDYAQKSGSSAKEEKKPESGSEVKTESKSDGDSGKAEDKAKKKAATAA